MASYINYDNTLMTYYDRLVDLIYHDKNLVVDEEMAKRIDFVLDTLYERERNILDLRYNQGLTLEEVGNELNITRERVRQIECKAIRKLRHPDRFNTIVNPEECVILQKRIMRLEELQLSRESKLEDLKEYLKQLEEKENNYTKLISDVKEKYNVNLETANVLLTIDDVDLSVRSHNCLRRAGYTKLVDISKLTYEQLLQIRNLGRRSIHEIKDVLVKNGFEITW